MRPEPLLAPFTDRGKEVSTGIVPGFDTGTNTENRWTIQGPTGIGPATSASGIGCIASGRLGVCTRRAATSARLRRAPAQLLESRSQTGSSGIGQRLGDRGAGRKARWRWSQRGNLNGVGWVEGGTRIGDRRSPLPWWRSRSS